LHIRECRECTFFASDLSALESGVKVDVQF
jgi:hypothetical protein